MKYKEKQPNLDLKLNIPTPTRVISQRAEHSTRRSSSSSSSSMERLSPASSCVSREPSPDVEAYLDYPNSPETTTSMMLAGCPGCLMYVIISEEDPKCPKCKSTVLLEFFKEERIKNSKA